MPCQFLLDANRITDDEYKILCKFKVRKRISSLNIYEDFIVSAPAILQILENSIKDVDVLHKGIAMKSAIQCGDFKSFMLLFQDEHFKNSVDHTDQVIACCKFNRWQILERLLSDPRVNFRSFGQVEHLPLTCLGFAVALGYLDVVKVLLRDSRVSATEYQGCPGFEYYPIGIAMEYKHQSIADYILDIGGIDSSEYYNYVIFKASEYGNVEIFSRLMNYPFNHFKLHEKTQHRILVDGNVQMAQRLLQHLSVEISQDTKMQWIHSLNMSYW